MGIIFSRIYDKPSTRDTLERIEQEIQNIEERRWDKIKREQFVVQILSFIPITILIANVCLFIYPSDSTLRDKLVYSVPIVILNLAFLLARKIVQWYSRWSLDNEEVRLRKLQKEKKRILEMVCETESYRVATELLEKYDPKQLRRRERATERPSSPLNTTLTKISASPQVKLPQQQQSQNVAMQGMHSMSFLNQSINPPPPILASPQPTPVARNVGKPQIGSVSSTNQHNASMTTVVAASSVQGRPVRPILSKDRSFFEKVVDWVVADGPENRFALICRYCYGHNGMSLAEEYETINFRCCYCYNLNTTTHKRQVHDQLQPTREKSETAPTTPAEKSEDQSSEKEKPKTPEPVVEDEKPKGKKKKDKTDGGRKSPKPNEKNSPSKQSNDTEVSCDNQKPLNIESS